MNRFEAIPTEVLAQTFADNYVPRSTTRWPTDAADRLNKSGLAIFDGIRSVNQFTDLARTFGEIRVHGQTDETGVTTMVSGIDYSTRTAAGIQQGVVETPFSNEQLFHTDGSVMADPPGVVGLYCETPDPHRPRVNAFASGRRLFQALLTEAPDVLQMLQQPISFGEVQSPVFYEPVPGLTAIRFRQAPEHPRMELPDEIRGMVDARLREPDILQGVTLQQGQAVFFNNNIVLHGLGASIGAGRVAKRVQLSTGTDPLIRRGFSPQL